MILEEQHSARTLLPSLQLGKGPTGSATWVRGASHEVLVLLLWGAVMGKWETSNELGSDLKCWG